MDLEAIAAGQEPINIDAQPTNINAETKVGGDLKIKEEVLNELLDQDEWVYLNDKYLYTINKLLYG